MTATSRPAAPPRSSWPPIDAARRIVLTLAICAAVVAAGLLAWVAVATAVGDPAAVGTVAGAPSPGMDR